MMLNIIATILISSFFTFVNSVTFKPVAPPTYPLAVRNPYLSAWMPGNQIAELASGQPEFWFGNPLNWAIIVRVDGHAYDLFGVHGSSSSSSAATVVSAEYTSTHSIFNLGAGSVQFTLDFFSPVSLTNYVRESLPFSYLTVTATAASGSPNVQIYSDIDETWTGQNASTSATRSVAGSTSILTLNADNAATYSQSADEIALWADVVYASRPVNGSKLSVATGSPDSVRGSFEKNGSLPTSASSWTAGDVAGIAHDLGQISGSKSVTYAIGVVRENAINYLGQAQTGFYRTEFSETSDALNHFLDDYDAAIEESDGLDSTIQTTGASVAGSNYSDILALSLRQIFGGVDVTAESTNSSTPLAFMKEISSDGNVNTIDVIFPTLPFWYALAPNYIRLLLEPDMAYMATGRWPRQFAIHDIGSNYPNATGHDNGAEEDMPIEESGNILILSYAYQLATGDTSFTTKYSALFKQFADYIAANGLYPTNQLSTTDGLGSFTNMTSLGIKSAVSLAAYGKMTGQSNYTSLGRSFASTINTIGTGIFTSNATDQPYFDIVYDNTTWYMQFNIMPDKLLGLDVFNQSTFNAQSAFYPAVRSQAGVAIEELAQWGKTDWQMWCAAASLGTPTGNATAQMFVDDLHAFMANGMNTIPFSDRYWVDGPQVGEGVFRARPTVGGHYALWAMKEGPAKTKR
ncbi:DUF1793-domain-containing protein [Rhizodiscina lignyota]|uniref:DUF1793-domain-containing protein n=1 Tax=Rhizodiscina lignyota TaxID=1504668 RepID=A0A9P4MBZ3_9PEZI|nr:DUF1793-domain-containing protein [Rhizodiscina lignyota]